MVQLMAVYSYLLEWLIATKETRLIWRRVRPSGKIDRMRMHVLIDPIYTYEISIVGPIGSLRPLPLKNEYQYKQLEWNLNGKPEKNRIKPECTMFSTK